MKLRRRFHNTSKARYYRSYANYSPYSVVEYHNVESRAKAYKSYTYTYKDSSSSGYKWYMYMKNLYRYK